MTDELRIERVIEAPPDVVFDTFTAEGRPDGSSFDFAIEFTSKREMARGS